MQSKAHWEKVYSTKAANEVSWFQAHAERSLRLIRDFSAAHPAASIIDVGGGASTLVDDLVAEGYGNVTVADISGSALATAKVGLGAKQFQVRWLEADVLKDEIPECAYDIWHDRAVFHFLTSAEARQTYVRVASRSVKPGGYLIVATFAEDGPTECSGLPVRRYRAEALEAEFGDRFQLVAQERELHRTPAGKEQPFIYCVFKKPPRNT